MTVRQLLSFAAVFCLSALVHAEPENVVVCDLTFARPPTWQWEEPLKRSVATTRFIVPGQTDDEKGDCRFYFPGKRPEEAQRLWRTYLARADSTNFRVETKTVGKRLLTYISFHGRAKVPGYKEADNQAFIGVVIPCQNDYMHVRFSGPRELIDKNTAQFKTMIERAITDKDVETADK